MQSGATRKRSASDYLVVYDISSDDERNRVDSLLKGYGFRIQKSVFECRLTRAMRSELTQRLETMSVQTGFIRIYRVDHSARIINIGTDVPGKDDGYAFIV